MTKGNMLLKRKTVVKSLAWKFAERCGAQISSFVVSMVLARILMPEEYGILSILLVFITLSQVIVQSGLGTALIQKENIDNGDYSAVFYISVGVAAVIYAVLYFFAPMIAAFFEIVLITKTLRIMSLSLFFGAGTTVLNAKLARELRFNKLFICNICASVISGVFGVVLAYGGFGVWSLVLQHLCNQILVFVILEIVTKWLPSGISSIQKIKPLIKYGYKVLIANLIGTGYNELRNLVIGAKYSSSTLAYYDRGKQFPHLIVSNLNTTIDNVMLPVYSASQNNLEQLKQMLRCSMKLSSYLIFPLIMGLCAIAKPLVSLLLTDKWLPCVPFLIINALTYLLMPLQTANVQVINAMGRSDIFLKLEVIKKICGVIILVFSVVLFDDAIFVAYGGLLIAILSTFINMTPNAKLINYSHKEQLADIVPSLFISILMASAVWGMGYIVHNNNILIPLQISVGGCIYILLSIITRNSSFRYCLDMIKEILNKSKKH